MQTAIWKFLALTGVIGLGCFVVYQVHTRIPVGDTGVGPGQFNALDDESTEGSTGPEIGSPGSDTETIDIVDWQSEPQTGTETSPAGDPPLIDWSEIPTQSEPATPRTASLDPDPFWSETPSDPASFPADLDNPEAPVLPSTAASELDDEPWLSVEQTEPLPATDDDEVGPTDPLLTGFETAPSLTGESAETPLPINPTADLRPLPGAYVPDDDEESSIDGFPEFAPVADSIADADVMPVEGLDQSPPANPFAFGPEDSADVTPDGDSAGLPLVEFPADAGPGPAARDAAVDPFAGFPTEPSTSASVMPVDPQNAGFAESSPLPTLPRVDENPFAAPPQVEENPFASPPQDDEAADPFDGLVVPSSQDSQQLPQLPALASDPFSEVMPVEENPEIATEPADQSNPLPALDLTEFNTEPPPAPPQQPLVTDGDFGTPAVASDSNTEPFSAIVDDEDESSTPGPFESFRPDPDPLPVTERNFGSAPPLDLVGDATIDGQTTSGSQQPELEIEKIAPDQATIGEPLIYAIHIKNIGSSAARGVVVEDRIPRGTTLDGTIPQAELTDGVLTWRMGTIGPGQEETIRIRVIPTEAGEIGSVAVVRFAAEVAAATNITSPDLRLEMGGPGEIALGETAVISYRLTNAGNGVARGAYIRCLLPAALEHPGGSDIEYEVGDLSPGQSSEIELTVRATKAGSHLSRTLLNSGGRTHDESELTLNVLPSRLLINREGPARRFVGRPAEYTTVVTNRSSTDLTGITVVEQLPAAPELAAIPATGQYDPVNRTVTWTIPGLAAGESYSISTSMVAREYGLHSSSIIARDRDGNEARVSSDLQVAGFSTIELDWEHEAGPVAVGEQVALRLTVRNQGTAPAENVQAVFELPPQMEFVNADGPVPFHQEGRLIRFENLDELGIDSEQSFDIVLTAAAPGNTRVSAQLRTADHTEPLRHDEPVFILQDEF